MAKSKDKGARFEREIARRYRDAADTGRIPAVHHRKNRQAPLVTIRLDDFIALLKSSIAV